MKKATLSFSKLKRYFNQRISYHSSYGQLVSCSPDAFAVRRTANQNAFTIVELLVVIVIIGILATITIIAYTGIQQRATVATLKSDLVNSSQSLKLYQVEHSAYPTAINDCPSPAEGNMCLKYSPNNTYPVFESINTNPQTFCLTVESANNTRYHITEDSVPEVGSCSFPFAGSLSAAATSPFSINLAWTEVPSATSYILQQDTTLAFTSATTIATITPPTATTFTSDNLLPNTPYFYRVNVTIDGNTSEWSAYDDAITNQLDVPTAPVVTANTVTDTTTWSWPDVTPSCAAGTTAMYQYRYTITPDGYDSGWVATASSPVAFTTSTEGQTYTVEVQAQCFVGLNNSQWSTSSGQVSYTSIDQMEYSSDVIAHAAYVSNAAGIGASGGTITYTDSNGLNPRSSPAYTGGYTVHTYTTVGNSTFTPTGSGSVEILVVGGGGGGRSNLSGGGGGGGVLTGVEAVTGNMTVTVGTGGAAGSPGDNSIFGTQTAVGGGRGGYRDGGPPAGTGGSGGGGCSAGA